MVKLPMQLGLIALSVVSFSAVANPLKQIPFHLSCKPTSGNFLGEVRGDYYMGSAGPVSIYAKNYKITRLNGQNGGNKANFNMGHSVVPMLGWENQTKSNDDLKQDGQWHQLSKIQYRLFNGRDMMEVGFEFIFDKSGPDPTCNVYKVLKP